MDILIKIANGDLTARCDVTGSDEIGMLAREVNNTGEKLHEAMSILSLTSVQFVSVAGEMHSTAEQIATAAEEVASQAGTVATASEEMSATSSEIAQSCTLAAQGAADANNLAIEGSGVVQETVFGMGDIADKVKETAVTIAGLGHTPTRSARLSAPSRILPIRPICWPSTPPSRRQGQVNRDADSQWLPMRCGHWRSGQQKQPARLPE